MARRLAAQLKLNRTVIYRAPIRTVVSMNRLFLILAVLLMAGCGGTQTGSTVDTNSMESQNKKNSETSVAPEANQLQIVITNRDDLSKYVGKIVTLRGTQTRSKIPHVLGVIVNGDYDLSEKMVEVTGRLTSFETTQADVEAFDEKQKKQHSAAIRPSVGINYTIRDPETGNYPKTSLFLKVKN